MFVHLARLATWLSCADTNSLDGTHAKTFLQIYVVVLQNDAAQSIDDVCSYFQDADNDTPSIISNRDE